MLVMYVRIYVHPNTGLAGVALKEHGPSRVAGAGSKNHRAAVTL